LCTVASAIATTVTKLVFGFGMFSWRELFSGKVCGCVPGLLRTGSPVVPNLVFSKQLGSWVIKMVCENLFENEPLRE
jgi:hypothetical protein